MTMSEVQDEPDVVQAFIDYTLSLPRISALVVNRVSGRLRTKSSKDPRGWQMPDFAIVFRAVPGPIKQEPGNVPLVSEPVQAEFYGPTLRESRRLWRTFRAEIFPDPIQQIRAGLKPKSRAFSAANCAVGDIQQMGAAAPLQESATDLPRTVVTLFVQYCTSAVPIPA